MPRPGQVNLILSSLRPSTQREYQECMEEFIEYCKREDLVLQSWSKVDSLLVRYVHHLYNLPEKQYKSKASKTICAIRFYCPEVKDLPLSSRALVGWNRLEPVQQHTPCPISLTLGIAYYLKRIEKPRMSLAVLLAFDCYLRNDEVRAIKANEVIFHKEPSPQNVATILLPKTKSQKQQYVIVRSMLLHSLLRRQTKDLKPSDKLFPFGAQTFRDSIHKVLHEPTLLNCPTINITPHSLRYGGATHDFLTRRLDITGIHHRGRWKRLKTTTDYIQAGACASTAQKIPTDKQEELQILTQNPGYYFNVPEVQSGWDA